MRKNLLYGFLFITGILLSQTPNTVVSKINYGDTLHVEGISVEFIEVISDSRCPTNVTCVRAGEATVLIEVYRNGKLIEQKELVFQAIGVTNSKRNSVYVSEEINITALGLFPYPKSPNKILKSDYCLELQIN